MDIDPQAVEVTKLSLFSRCWRANRKETLAHQRSLFHERALPDLANNIRCGNSLAGPDIYSQVDAKEITTEDHERLNVFDWEKAFPWYKETGGFDAVIGNPPYIRIQRIAKLESDYIFRNYEGPTSKVDLSRSFSKKAGLCVRKALAASSARHSGCRPTMVPTVPGSFRRQAPFDRQFRQPSRILHFPR